MKNRIPRKLKKKYKKVMRSFNHFTDKEGYEWHTKPLGIFNISENDIRDLVKNVSVV
jgi:hypothetical protein